MDDVRKLVKVKPLDWFEGDEPGEWRASEYDVWRELGKFQVYYWSIIQGDPHETAEAAKAAAQADYESRIYAALTPSPSAHVAGMKEAAGVAEKRMQEWAAATYQNPDARMQNAAKTYAAGDIVEAILARAALLREAAKALKGGE